jgi:hypothetical protein
VHDHRGEPGVAGDLAHTGAVIAGVCKVLNRRTKGLTGVALRRRCSERPFGPSEMTSSVFRLTARWWHCKTRSSTPEPRTTEPRFCRCGNGASAGQHFVATFVLPGLTYLRSELLAGQRPYREEEMRVVAYIRVSSAHQAEAYGPEVQRAAIAKWAKANGH